MLHLLHAVNKNKIYKQSRNTESAAALATGNNKSFMLLLFHSYATLDSCPHLHFEIKFCKCACIGKSGNLTKGFHCGYVETEILPRFRFIHL